MPAIPTCLPAVRRDATASYLPQAQYLAGERHPALPQPIPAVLTHAR